MDVSVNGPVIYARINKLYEMFKGTMADTFGNFGNLITQTTVSLFAVTILLIILAKVATRNISKRPGKLQVIVEKLINMLYPLANWG